MHFFRSSTRSLVVLLLVATCSVTVLRAQSITFTNPILQGFYPDPSIVRAGNDYYLVNSTFSYFPGLPIFHSKDLKNWKQIGNAIDRPSQMQFLKQGTTRGLFAPGISFHNGTFYLACTNIDDGGNFVITATNPAGPWSDPVWLKDVRGIDPSVHFIDDKAYIIYNSDPPEHKSLYPGHRTIRMYEFDPVALKVVGEEKILVNGGVDISKKPVWIEGPHLLQRNGWYYLSAAEGGTSVNHSQVVFRSKSVWGPYVPYEKNPILTQRGLPDNRKDPVTSTGHAQFVDGPDGNTYAIFLACRPYEGDYYNTGRETFIAPVQWKDEWPVINPDHTEVQYQYTARFPEVKQAGALPQSGNFSYTVQFAKSWDPSLLYLRSVDSHAFKRDKKGLSLLLKPATVQEMGVPSFVGKRQQHLYASAETELRFAAAAEHEKAGFMVYQAENHFYYLCQSVAAGKPVLQLYKGRKGEEMQLLASQELVGKPGAVQLKIDAKGGTYDFSYAVKKGEWKLLQGGVDAKYVSTRTAGGFTGCFFALYATSLGKPSTSWAQYAYLRYSGNDPMYNK
ncbi:glycoside hydrolase family 43 protein [Paraflavitalea pollutisoli]|uniref:glycoside hydrolase family 43 protein n=1 Tax=Paraflavitalea pollutisoli TaxID=3034143 RepID=UPI0023EB6EBB|nr:glycoside hydrolase family 43 protein [Paraflavitalea sp. H1-2-19X]